MEEGKDNHAADELNEMLEDNLAAFRGADMRHEYGKRKDDDLGAGVIAFFIIMAIVIAFVMLCSS